MASLSPPATPGSENPQRPRAFSALSNGSRRSRRSSGENGGFSGNKIDNKLDLTESHSEKKRLNANSMADPTKALNEAQPCEPEGNPKKKVVRFADDPPAMVALTDSNLGDLRTMIHKDAAGNPIHDPDRANPTRPRMERPLETIMSFQRAAEYTDSTRRSPYAASAGSKMDYHPATDSRGEGNRRSSYYAGSSNYGPSSRSKQSGGGYYGRSSSYGFRPDSYVEEGMGHNQYQPSNRGMRNSAAVMYGPNGENLSPSHSHQISYETMTSGSEENAKTTNPSSVNSSLDHIQPYRKQDDGTNMASYGSNNSTMAPHGSGPPFMQNGMQNGNGHGSMQNGNSHTRHANAPMAAAPVNNPRVPIKLNSGTMSQAELDAEAAKLSPMREKRKSWIKRRFSKRES